MKPSTPEDLTDTVLASVRPLLETKRDVRFAYLFGSVAKGRVRSGSDVDVAVWLDGEQSKDVDRVRQAQRALEIESELERALRHEVQVVVLNTAPLELLHNVLRHSRLIISRDEPLRRRIYVEHAKRYYDMAPARALFRRAMRRRIQEGRFGGGTGNRA